MRPLLASSLAFALSVLALSPSPAEAQGTTARQEAARAIGGEGLKLFNSGKWQEALEMFRRAESEFHAVTLVLYMAHCQRMLGKLVDARSLYQQIAGETLGPDKPNQFVTAQIQARAELERLRPRIPVLVLTFKGAVADRVRVTLDGALVPVSERASLALDPGEHALVATVEHAAPIHRKITLNEGVTARVELAFDLDVEPESPPRSSAAPAVIAFSVGAVGLGVGAITGALALAQASDLKARCLPTNHCPAADRPSADTAKKLADASTVGLIAGGAAILTGVVLVLVRSSGGVAQRTEASPVRFNVGLGVVTMEGAF